MCFAVPPKHESSKFHTVVFWKYICNSLLYYWIWGIPRGWGLQHNRTMVIAENFEKNPKRYQDPALSLLGGKNSKIKQHLLFLFFFSLYTLEGTIKAPTVVLYKLNTLKRSHNGFFNLLKVRQYPCPLYMGVPSHSGRNSWNRLREWL